MPNQETSEPADISAPPEPPKSTPEAPASPAEAHAEPFVSAPTEGAPAPDAAGSVPAAAAGPQAGDATPAGDGTPRKRKRRRRRKKGGGPNAVGGGAAPGGSPGEAAAEGEASVEDGEETEGEAGEHDGTAKAEPAASGARGEHDGKRKKKNKKERPHGAPREPRERPAFNLGDVVFGKILEITDEAILIDLAGKGKAIFDRREMDLPDEPPEEASAATPAKEEEDENDEASAGKTEETAAPSPAEQTPKEESPAAELGTPAVAPSSPAPSDPGARPSPEPQRRIIVARAIIEAESKPVDEPPPADSPPPDAPTEAPKDDAATGTEDSSATAATTSSERPSAAPPPAHRPPVYAPPIVLELGAHFVGLVHNDGARGGLVVLTRHPRRLSKSKVAVNAAFKEHRPVSGLVTGVVKGGVEVDIDGLRAFTPGSHMDVRLGADMHQWIARRLDFLVTQYGKRGRDVVLSRKPMIEAGARAAREEALAKLPIGTVVKGTVRSVVQFGAFIDVGGVEGLVPLPEMSHNRADTPSDVFKAGETVEVKILRVDERGKVWLSRRAALADPWAEVAKKYAVGTRHTGKVVRLQPFGAFVELENAVDGLIHTVDLSIKRIEDPSEVVKVGDAIEVVVASLDPGAHKIGLHPAPKGAAADEPHQRVQLNKPVKCAVVGVEAGGLVVRILGATGRHARGFITAAGTGTPRGTELRKPFPVGTQLEAKVIEMDPKRGEIKLSIKALHEETERSAYQQYRAQVTREAKFGTFADLLKKHVPQK